MMMYRVFAGSVAILGAALVLAPAAADARGGGMGGGRGFAMHGFRPGFHQMLLRHRFFGRSNLPLSNFGGGFAGGYGYGGGGDYSNPVTYPIQYGLYDLPPSPWAFPVAATPAVRRPCTSEVRKVPSEDGGERAITVTRC
jgi:hypothetical protein